MPWEGGRGSAEGGPGGCESASCPGRHAGELADQVAVEHGFQHNQQKRPRGRVIC